MIMQNAEGGDCSVGLVSLGFFVGVKRWETPDFADSLLIHKPVPPGCKNQRPGYIQVYTESRTRYAGLQSEHEWQWRPDGGP